MKKDEVIIEMQKVLEVLLRSSLAKEKINRLYNWTKDFIQQGILTSFIFWLKFQAKHPGLLEDFFKDDFLC